MLRTLVTAAIILISGLGGQRVNVPPVSAAPSPSSWLRGWPMVGHDPQRSNRTATIAPTRLHLRFTVHGIYAPVAIGADNTIYGWEDGGMTSINATGRLRWRFPSGEGEGGPPALGPNDRLYVVGYPAHIPSADPAYMRVFALSDAGRLRWQLHPNFFAKGAAPLVSARDTLFAPFVGPISGKLSLISPRGTTIRTLLGASYADIAQAPDGTIAAVLNGDSLVSLSPSGKARWRHTVNLAGDFTALMVGTRGEVGVATATGMAVYDSAGRRRWTESRTGPVLALASLPGDRIAAASERRLSAFDGRGRLLWQVRLGISANSAPLVAVIAVDGRGTIYVLDDGGTLHVVSSAGKQFAHRTVCRPQPFDARQVAVSANHDVAILCGDDTLRVYG